MRKLFLFALLACAGCLENHYICEIEYMDGTKECIECFYAKVDEPLFGAPTVLTIEIYEGGRTQQKALATIKRWRLLMKEGVK